MTRNFGGGRYLKASVNGKTVSVHRLIMEQIIGRPLGINEVVHHINGDKKDNRPENLQVMSVSEHSRMENLGRKLSPEHVESIRKANIGNKHRLGIPHTPEIKAQISASMKKARALKNWSTKK